MISHDGKRILILEGPDGSDYSNFNSSLGWAHLDAIRILKKLPVDKRHNAKIDYPALHKLLEKTTR